MLYYLLVNLLAVSSVQGGSNILDELADIFQDGSEERERFCAPPVYDGMIVTPFKRSYADGETIEISCGEGYELNAWDSRSTCRAPDILGSRGTFIPIVTGYTCKESPGCKAPLEHGIIFSPQKAKYDIGENITISCIEGYELVGQDVYTCKRSKRFQGTYTAEIGTHGDYDFSYARDSFGFDPKDVCREIMDCDVVIQEGLHVEPFKRTYSPGEEIFLYCDEEYDLVVSNFSVCLNSGEFSFSPQRACRQKRKCMSLHFAGLIVKPQKDYYLTGEKVTLSCEEGYDFNGPEESVCGSDEEEGEFYRLYDIRADFVPHVGYGTCTEKPKCFGYWPRKAIVTPDKDYYYGGDTVTVACTEGYRLVGKRTRKCLAGHGQLYGQFSPDKTDICEKIVTCEAPDERGVVLTPNKPFYETGETVSISCESRYVLMAANESTCETKKRFWPWKPRGKFEPEIDHDVCEKIPSCDKPEYEGLIVTPEQEFYAIGDKVTLSCEEGYEQRVAPSSTCRRRFVWNHGEFDPSLDDEEPCIKPATCQALDDPHLVMIPTKELYQEGDVITLSCEEGYKLKADEEMTCERALHCKGQLGKVSGCFHPAPPRVLCVKLQACDQPDSREGMIITPDKDAYYPGDEIKISCAEGYKLVGPEKIECRQTSSFKLRAIRTGFKERKFHPDLPDEVCKRKRSCAAPSPQRGMVLYPTEDIYYTGDRVRIECEEGYRQIGPEFSQCVTIRKAGAFKPNLERVVCKELPRQTTEETIEYLGPTTTVETPRYVGTTTTEETSEYVEPTPFLP